MLLAQLRPRQKATKIMRPTIINETLIAELLTQLDQYDITTACEVVGITPQTYRNWRKKGNKDLDTGNDTIEARFWIASQKCRGRAKGPVIDSLRSEAMNGNIAAAKMWLQACDRKTWGDQIKIEEKITEFMRALQEVLSPEEFERVLYELDDEV